MEACNKQKLRRDIQTYWRRRLGWEHYITQLLPREMACALADDDSTRLPSSGCHLLVLLVGYSWEPLFQAVWAYRPRRILLILNEHYGQTPAAAMEVEIRRLLVEVLAPQAELSLDPTAVDSQPIPGSDRYTTQHVFQALLDHLKDNPPTIEVNEVNEANTRPVVIDITGAKKSMMAGAFLFAAYSGIPVSYVDFDDDAYDEDKGKPYGYACRIGEVANPYQDFALRDWEQVRTLYSRYNFRGAQRVIETTVKPAMQKVLPGHMKALDHFERVLACYDLWDNGDFSRAKQKAEEIKAILPDFEPPSAVAVLGRESYWPSGDTARSLLQKLEDLEFGDDQHGVSLYLRPELLLIYAHDELSRIQRLINFNEDYRSALLKGVSLWEVLSRARVVGLWHANMLDITADPKGDYHSRGNAPPEIEAWEETVYYGLICTSSGGFIEAALKYDPLGNSKARQRNLRITCRRDVQGNPMAACQGGLDQTFYVRRSGDGPLLLKEVSLGNLETLRHKAIHTYLSVPRSIADEVYRTVKANLEDYEANWLPAIWPGIEPPLVDVERLTWSAVCRVCQLDFLPANLQQNETAREVI